MCNTGGMRQSPEPEHVSVHSMSRTHKHASDLGPQPRLHMPAHHKWHTDDGSSPFTIHHGYLAICLVYTASCSGKQTAVAAVEGAVRGQMECTSTVVDPTGPDIPHPPSCFRAAKRRPGSWLGCRDPISPGHAGAKYMYDLEGKNGRGLAT